MGPSPPWGVKAPTAAPVRTPEALHHLVTPCRAHKGRAFSLSAGSLCEAAAALDLAGAIGLAEPAEAAALLALAARVKCMLRALTAGAR